MCSAGQALGLGLDELEAAEAFNEQELLERMRTAVSCNQLPRTRQPQPQRRLSAFSAMPTDPATAAGLAQEQQLLAGGAGEEGVVTDSAYEEELDTSIMRQISQEMEEVLQAIDAQQQKDAQAAVASIAEVQQAGGLSVLQDAAATAAGQGEYDEYDGAQSEYQSDAPTSHTPYTDVWDGEDEGEKQPWWRGWWRLCGSSCGTIGTCIVNTLLIDPTRMQSHRQLDGRHAKEFCSYTSIAKFVACLRAKLMHQRFAPPAVIVCCSGRRSTGAAAGACRLAGQHGARAAHSHLRLWRVPAKGPGGAADRGSAVCS